MDGVTQGDGAELFSIFPLLVLARWIHFSAVFVLFGSAFFWFYMDEGFVRARRATDKLLRLAAPVAALSGLGWILAIIANMAGGFGKAVDPETLSLLFFETQFGPVVLIRLVLLAAAVVVAAWPGHGRAWLSAQMHIGSLLLIDQAWLGHAAEGGAGLWGALMVCVYCVHCLAAATWLGGLPPLFCVLREAHRAGGGNESAGAISALLRFSVVALPAVGLIVASGAGNAGFRVGASLQRMVLADYGYVLCVKAALVAAMLALAYYNRFVALPQLRDSSAPGEAILARLRVSVGGELALGLAVLAAAAVLGITPPPQ